MNKEVSDSQIKKLYDHNKNDKMEWASYKTYEHSLSDIMGNLNLTDRSSTSTQQPTFADLPNEEKSTKSKNKIFETRNTSTNDSKKEYWRRRRLEMRLREERRRSNRNNKYSNIDYSPNYMFTNCHTVDNLVVPRRSCSTPTTKKSKVVRRKLRPKRSRQNVFSDIPHKNSDEPNTDSDFTSNACAFFNPWLYPEMINIEISNRSSDS